MNLEIPSQQDHDAARRIRDTVNLHLVAQSDIKDAVGKWIAIRLEDGRTDNTLYDSKDNAMLYQSDPKRCCYLKITPDGITVKDAWRFLVINRNPAIDVTAPEHKINPVIFPHMSNLSTKQKVALNKYLRRNPYPNG